MSWVALIAGSFLVGAIPFSFLAARFGGGSDLRRVGSRNPGATNALRTAGLRAGLAGLVLDSAKGFLPVWLARAAALPDRMLAVVAVACVVGHVVSPFLGFRGGKGVATGFGALSALNPVAGAFALSVFVAVAAATRIVSLGSIAAVVSLPLFWFVPARTALPPVGGESGWWAVAAVCLIVLVRHLPNLRRLAAGTESRLGEKSA